ncbi:hypothetical protein AgCh_038426 [Apium graveolens]
MEILLAELNRVCIYSVPKYMSYSESVFKKKEAYNKAIGYQEEDGKLGNSDTYVERVRSCMKLYGALVQTEADGVKNPHGIEEGWALMARFLNALPANLYTAVSLQTFIEMAGFALYRRYRSQFKKMLNIISRNFVSALEQRPDQANVVMNTSSYLKKIEISRHQDARALSKLQMGVTKPIFTRISRALTAKEAWEILEGEFHGDEKVRSINLQYLKKDFQNLKMKDSENIQSYHARVMEIVNQMKTYGDNISDQHVVEKFLISLTDKYEYIVTVIEETKDLTKLSMKKLMGSLQAHEKRRLKQAEQSESVFLSKAKVKP